MIYITEILCAEYPSLLTRIQIMDQMYPIGSMLRIKCDGGYNVSGGTFHCNENGTWNIQGNIPDCQGAN